MPQFTYIAMDDAGRKLTGAIEAAGRSEAIAALAARRVFVTELARHERAEAPAQGGGFSLRLSGRVSLRSKTAMLRQLATALRAGLALLQALQVVAEQAESAALRDLATDLARRVKQGESLSEAMGANSATFSRLEVSMTRVGETAGVLDVVMGYLSDFCEREFEVRQQIRAAATYPLFVLVLAAVSVVIVITAILPRVVGAVAAETDVAMLPAPTRMMLALSGALVSYGWLAAILAVAGAVAFRRWIRTPRGRLAWDSFKLRIPVFGKAVRRIAVSRFARTLGTLSASGIQILEALDVLRDTLGNEALARGVDGAAEDIAQGHSIAEPLRKTGQFPPLLTQVIAMGETTGKLDELLLRAADTYEKETASAVQRVMSVLPAALIVLLAGVVAFILSAVLLPIVEMETSVGGF